MSAQDFTEEQRRYLEGFVSGVQARRAAQGLKPLAAEGGAAQPAGPDKEHLAAMARFEAAGRKLSPIGVRAMRRPRVKRAPPTAASRAWMRALMAGWPMPMARAARLKLPSRAMRSNAVSWARSIRP